MPESALSKVPNLTFAGPFEGVDVEIVPKGHYPATTQFRHCSCYSQVRAEELVQAEEPASCGRTGCGHTRFCRNSPSDIAANFVRTNGAVGKLALPQTATPHNRTSS